MRFLWPEMLWLLVLLPMAALAYVWMLRRRKRQALRFASLDLVRAAIGRGQRWRRHLPPALVFVALALALFAASRPSAEFTLPSQQRTVILAMDVSRSMRVTDVEPNRISAAQAAAKAFVEELPRDMRVGVVSFAGTASVVQTPTDNRQDVLDAIDRFQLQMGTATGSGLILALSQLFPEDGIDLESAVFGKGGARGAPLPGRRADQADSAKPKPEPRAPVPAGSYTNGAIVLLSDGRRTTGPDPLEAAMMAADRGVRVHTVGFGTKEGGALQFGEWAIYVRLDEEALKAVAAITLGQYFHAASGTELNKVYEAINTRFALERRDTEIAGILSALAVVLLTLGLWLSMRWFSVRLAAPAPARGSMREGIGPLG